MAKKSKKGVLEAYADLLIRTITNLVYLDPPQAKKKPLPTYRLYSRVEAETPEQRELRRIKRMEGGDWPAVAHTMVGYKRLRNLADCVLDVLDKDIKGNFIETGVWRGGACILMRGIASAAGESKRKVYVADSFAGLPPPNADDYPADTGDTHHTRSDQLGVSLEQVKANFDSYGLLNDNVVFMKGWFKDTLPTLTNQKFAIIRLDGDMYESTIQALDELYPRLVKGGYVIIDDFGVIAACRKAVGDYREKHGIEDEIVKVDRCGVYWRKS